MRTLWIVTMLMLSAGQAVANNIDKAWMEGNLEFKPKVIYGEDNRRDLFEVDSELYRNLADSTVALMFNTKISDNGDGTSSIQTRHFGDSNSLCNDEPFREQETAAFCSGFLVAPDTIVTAGHCIDTNYDCERTKFVFNFAIHEEGLQPTSVLNDDVYGCSELVHSEARSYNADFAVIKLDRPVMNHQPLALRMEGEVTPGTDLVVIGHPSGLPTKVSDGAKVRSLHTGYFMANLDTYGGNSGSAVFNSHNGDVEGILVRGEQDFEFQNGCRKSKICLDDGCRGEDVTRIANVLPYLQ